MDPTDSAQEGLTCSSRGRLRKRNCKYSDFETSDAPETTEEAAAPPRRGRGRPKSTAGRTLKRTKDGRGKTAQTLEDGTPRPKRKYVKRQKVDVSPEVPAEPDVCEHPEDKDTGGRHRRGAAKQALKYLHRLANDVFADGEDSGEDDAAVLKTNRPQSSGRQGRKRKRLDSVSSGKDDEDFVPEAAEEEEEDNEDEEEDEEGMDEEDDEEDEDNEEDSNWGNLTSKSTSGLTKRTLRVVLDSAQLTQKLRKQNFSSCVFPEWIPTSSDWVRVPLRDVESFLPQELRSAAFRVSREGLQHEDSPQQRLHRFEALPAHPQRWDMMLFVGGPVWALEWCPTPDGSAASQYVAVAAHRGMDDLHYMEQTCSEPGLVQLWDVGPLDYNSRPQHTPCLSYALVHQHGFIWQLKFCPSGAWESSHTPRQPPLMHRLALLAVASSNGEVSVYSLPHPHALHTADPPASGNVGEGLPIYKAAAVVTLKLGSLKAPRQQRSGMVLALDWLPMKPHDVLAAGFYDGTVALWNLSARSSLLRMRDPRGGGITLLPYRCFLAHDHAVRGLSFCPASSHLLVSVGDDRYVKTWDLRRTSDAITANKRFSNNEVHWMLNATGLLLAMDVAFAAQTSRGLHYTDLSLRSVPIFPRPSTLWSLSYSDWLHSVLVCDAAGDVIFNLLPQMDSQAFIKRNADKRFPLFTSSLIPREEEEDEQMKDEEKINGEGAAGGEGGAAAGGEGGAAAGGEEGGAAAAGGEGEGGEGGASDGNVHVPKYKEAATKHCLQLTDFNTGACVRVTQQSLWKLMRSSETSAKLNLDQMNLGALHKVRFSPNQCSHVWVVSGGQAGLVRLMCLKNLINTHMKKIIGRSASSSLHHTEAL